MTERVSGRELARRLGLSEGAIRKHVRSGLYRANRDGLFDVAQCTQALENGRDPDAALKGLAGGMAVSKEPKPDGPKSMMEGSLVKARTAQALLRAQREQIELSRTKGDLIAKSDVIKAMMAVVTVVNERIDGAAAQIGPRVVGLDAAAAERVARDILNGVRAEIAGMANAVEVVTNQVTA